MFGGNERKVERKKNLDRVLKVMVGKRANILLKILSYSFRFHFGEKKFGGLYPNFFSGLTTIFFFSLFFYLLFFFNYISPSTKT